MGVIYFTEAYEVNAVLALNTDGCGSWVHNIGTSF